MRTLSCVLAVTLGGAPSIGPSHALAHARVIAWPERGVSQPSRGEGTVLKWIWTEGESRRYEVEESMTERSGDTTKRSGRTITFRQTVLSVDAAGAARVEQTFERVEAWFEQDRTRLEHPRDPTAREHPSIAPFAALEGGSFTFVVDVEGMVRSVEGLDELLQRAFGEVGRAPSAPGRLPGVGGLDPAELMQAETGVLTPEAMRQWVEQGLRIVPGRAVRRGETWRVEASQELPFVGTIDTGRSFTLRRLDRGREGVVATIEMVSGERPSSRGPTSNRPPRDRSSRPGRSSDRSPDPNDPASMLRGLGIDFTLVERSMAGTFRFDAGAGQVESGSTRQVMEWEVRMPDVDSLLDPTGPGAGRPKDGDSVVRYRIEQESRLRLLAPGA